MTHILSYWQTRLALASYRHIQAVVGKMRVARRHKRITTV